MSAILKVWRQMENKAWLSQWMHISLKNNSVKFHADPIWHDRALGFFEEVAQQQEEQDSKIRAIRDQFLI